MMPSRLEFELGFAIFDHSFDVDFGVEVGIMDASPKGTFDQSQSLVKVCVPKEQNRRQPK